MLEPGIGTVLLVQAIFGHGHGAMPASSSFKETEIRWSVSPYTFPALQVFLFSWFASISTTTWDGFTLIGGQEQPHSHHYGQDCSSLNNSNIFFIVFEFYWFPNCSVSFIGQCMYAGCDPVSWTNSIVCNLNDC